MSDRWFNEGRSYRWFGRGSLGNTNVIGHSGKYNRKTPSGADLTGFIVHHDTKVLKDIIPCIRNRFGFEEGDVARIEIYGNGRSFMCL
jgi:hypothetical protein